MELSTGKVGFKLPFDNGDAPIIYFNPRDKELQQRIQKFEENVNARADKINTDRYKSNFDNTIPDIDFSDPDAVFALTESDIANIQKRCDAILELEKEYNDIVKSELNEVFQSNISDAVFKYCEPFDVVVYTDDKGEEKREVYTMQFLRWLVSAIGEYSDNNNKAINKHIAKYANGTH